MVSLGAVDWVILILFLLGIFTLGFSARVRDATPLQFIAAGRNLTLPSFVATLVSTWYGGILGIGESVSYFGIGTFILMGVPYYVFAAIYAVFLARDVRREAQISIPERLGWRFGNGSALVGGALLFLLAVPAAHSLMLGVLVSLLSGWSLTLSVVVASLVGTAFVYRGGLIADVRVSMLAFAMMYIGFGVMVMYCISSYPPSSQWSLIAPELRTWDGGAGWVTVLGFFVLGSWTLVDPGFHQRVASAATPEEGRRGVLVSIGFWFLFDLLTITTGMYALALLPQQPTNGLEVLPVLGSGILPEGIRGLFFCGMIGTILAALVGYSLVAGATVGRDIVARLGIRDDGKTTMLVRLGILISMLAAIGLALSVKSVVNLWYQWGGAVIGALLLPVWLSYRTRRTSADSGAAVAMLLAFCLGAGWLIYGKSAGNDMLEAELFGAKFPLGTLLPALLTSALVLGFVALLKKIYGRTD